MRPRPTGTCGTGFCFGSTNARFHALMVGGLAGTIALVLVLIAILERPFSRGTGVNTAAYQEVRASVDQFLRNNSNRE